MNRFHASILFLISLLLIFIFSCGIVEPGEDDDGYQEEITVHEIWLIDIGNGKETLLTHGQFPKFAPDGDHILFMKDYSTIHSFDLTRGKAEQLLPTLRYLEGFSLSLRNKRIIFSALSFGGYNSDLFVAFVDGRDYHNLTNSNFISEYSPSFSPDGKLIVYRDFNTISTTTFAGRKEVLREVGGGRASSPRLCFSNEKLLYIEHPSKYLRIVDLKNSQRDTLIRIVGEFYSVSPTRDEILFSQGRLYLFDLHTYESRTIADYGVQGVFSPDGQSALYLDLRRNLNLIDLRTLEVKTIKSAEVIYNRIHSFSISATFDKIVYQKDYEVTP